MGKGCSLPTTRGLGRGCVPSPENFSIFELKEASFSAFYRTDRPDRPGVVIVLASSRLGGGDRPSCPRGSAAV